MVSETKTEGHMVKIGGRGIGTYAAIGKLYFKKKREYTPPSSAGTTEEELALFAWGRARAEEQTDLLISRAAGAVGESEAAIFGIHKMLLGDEDFIEMAEDYIRKGYSAVEAVTLTEGHFVELFSGVDDAYLAARAVDIKDVCHRLLDVLQHGDGADELFVELNEGTRADRYLLVADELTPGEAVQLDTERVVGLVTFGGTINSHTAILARAMNLPTLIGTGEIDGSYHGASAILDPMAGRLVIHPNLEELDRFSDEVRERLAREKRWRELVGRPTATKSGRRVMLYANVGVPSEAELAMENDAEGIGLMRSEFLYLGRSDYPDEASQIEAYRAVLSTVGGRRVIVRTLDVGADKKAAYLDLDPEENPALGLRGIRVSLGRRELFKTQLRALCRASAYGKLAIMLPMVVSEREVKESRALLTEVKNELRYEDVPFDEDIELGIMIETPAAAVMSDVLAGQVDFFSVGTNDLCQYTLAADRQNAAVSALCEENREAVLRLIEMAARNAHEKGIWIGVCGEMAADLSLTERFLSMGIDELSVSPPFVLALREKIVSCE